MKRKRNSSLFWEEHDAELRRLAEEEHLTSKQVAEKLGVSRDAVTGRGKRIGVKWHLPPLFRGKTLARIVEDRKAEKRTLEPDKDYWKNRYGWTFPPHGHCIFPKGDVRNSNFSFCGEPVTQDGKSYCQTHHLIAYYRTTRGV